MEEQRLPDWWVGAEEAEWGRGGAYIPLVFLVGLDAKGSDRSLWEILRLHSNKDFAPHYVPLPLTHTLPPKKQKRPEGAAPMEAKGVLSSGWIHKHKEIIPAVVVVFLTSTDPQAVARVREMKVGCSAHGSVLLVVLLEGSQISEGSVSVEKASALCAAVDLPPKVLFLLPHATHPDRIAASLHRLETGMKEGAKTYYGGRVRRVRTSKERILPSHFALSARYAFKLGFFHEIRRDYVAAISSYEGTIEALRGVGGLEARVVGGLAALRMARLLLLRGETREAKVAMDKVASLLQGKDVQEFEHWSWLQTLWGNFAELVREEHRRMPYPANTSTILDPVTFFLAAAKWARLRAQRAKASVIVEWPNELDEWKIKGEVKYFGQRPWIGEVQGNLDPAKAAQALRFLEQRTDHSAAVIRYLGVASEFCKDYRPRTRSQLMALMGEEFCAGAEWSRALILATHVVHEVGAERWGTVLAHAAKLGLRASEAEPNPSNYLSFATVLLSSEVRPFVADEVRQSLWSNIEAVRQKQPPPLPIYPDVFDVDKWNKALSSTPMVSYVRVHRGAIVEARACFTCDSVKVNEPCEVRIHIKLNREAPVGSGKIKVRRVAVTTSVPELEASKEVSLELEVGGQEKVVEVTVTPTSKEAGKVLAVGVVSVDIGHEQDSQIILHFSPKLYANPTLWVNDDDDGVTMWKNAVRVEGAKAEVEVALDIVPPLLCGERRRVNMSLENRHKAKVSKVVFALVTYPSQVRVQIEGESKVGGVVAELDGLQGGGTSHSSTVWVDIPKDGNPGSEITLVGRARYVDTHGENLTAEKALTFDLVKPFEVIEETRHSAGGEPLGRLTEGAVFLHLWTLRNVSGIDLTLQTLKVNIISTDVILVGKDTIGDGSKILKSGEELSSFLLLQVAKLPCDVSPLAKLHFQWTREGIEEDVFSEYDCFLTGKPSTASSDTAANAIEVFVRGGVGRAVLKRSLVLFLAIRNPTPYVLDLSLNMDSTEYFMTAGPKKMSVKIGGGEETFLDYILFPLKTGLLRLPSLGVECSAGPVTVIRDVPPTVFVTGSIYRVRFPTQGIAKAYCDVIHSVRQF